MNFNQIQKNVNHQYKEWNALYGNYKIKVKSYTENFSENINKITTILKYRLQYKKNIF
jgi:hypothetical protein